MQGGTLAPAPGLTWRELACINRVRDERGRPVAWCGIRPGGLVAPYPYDYRTDPTRLPRLLDAWRVLRAAVGGPIVITSAYRTPLYNAAVGGAAHSQHVQGRALDLATPEGWEARAFQDLVCRLAPQTPIRYVRRYPWGVHIDVRPAERLVIADD